MQFKSVADLSDDIVRWLPRLPRDIDLVVGIPRSGMLPATLIALHMQKPLAAVKTYLDEQSMCSGSACQSAHSSLTRMRTSPC